MEPNLRLEATRAYGVDMVHDNKHLPDPIKHSIPYMLQVAARLQSVTFMASIIGNEVHPAESYVLHELWKSAIHV